VTSFLDLSASMTLNDLEFLPPQKDGFLLNFSQFLDAAHISTLNKIVQRVRCACATAITSINSGEKVMS